MANNFATAFRNYYFFKCQPITLKYIYILIYLWVLNKNVTVEKRVKYPVTIIKRVKYHAKV